MIKRNYNRGLFLSELDGLVISLRTKMPSDYIPWFGKPISKILIHDTQKNGNPPKCRSKGIFCEQLFFLLFQKLTLTLHAKNQVPICLLSLSKFNIEYIAEISKKAITQQKNENSKI